jgi:hypothetical protein
MPPRPTTDDDERTTMTTLRLSGSLAALAFGGLSCASPPSAKPPPAEHVTVLPTEFVADRIHVTPVMADGRRLRLYTDSGGGTQMLWEGAVRRLGLPTSPVVLGKEQVVMTPIPVWRSDASIPSPLAIHQSAELQNHYLVMPDQGFHDGDGFLGQGWFGGRVWTFDYPGRRLLLRHGGDLPPHAEADEVPLHFPKDERGVPYMHFARFTIEIAGERLDMLLDTGATLTLSPEGLAALGEGPAQRATSFITRSISEKWRAAHPDWRVIEKAEKGTGAAIIEVPRVKLGQHEVGPVWFSVRGDDNFHKYMSSMMDAQVEGAIGGSAFRYLIMSVDYPHELAVFQRP